MLNPSSGTVTGLISCSVSLSSSSRNLSSPPLSTMFGEIFSRFRSFSLHEKKQKKENSEGENKALKSPNMSDPKIILSEQRRELVSAEALESDINFAFDLQMQEAMTASLALQPSTSSSSSSSPSPVDRYSEDLSFALLIAEDLERIEQEMIDRAISEAEMRRFRDDLDRRIHDQKVANDILRMSDDEWKTNGVNYGRPYGHGSQSKGMADENFRVYIKGLVSEERVRDSNVTVAAIGVAICDSKDNLIFELRKPLVDDDGEKKSLMSGVEVGIVALIEGLNAAIALDLKRVSCFCDEYLIHQYVTGRLPPRGSKICKLIVDLTFLKTKVTNFTVSLVARNDIKFAYKLARDAIVSQITWPSETDHGKNLMETCVICFEDIVDSNMFSVDDCLHRFCFSCMKQHVEVKLLNGMMANCPHEACKSEVTIDRCGEFLDPKLLDIMKRRIKEASIPDTEKIYCPYPRCSALMSKREVLEYTKKLYVGSLPPDGARKCTKCHFFFCINCNVPWHNKLTCDAFKRSKSLAEDAKLKSLAVKQLWRQCGKCNHMIELAMGCNHIYCRCGHEFCYTCGAGWKNKKATCTCPLWTARSILVNDQRRRG